MTTTHYPRAFTEYDGLWVASRDKSAWNADERAALAILAETCPLGSRREDGTRVFTEGPFTFSVAPGKYAGQIVSRVN